MKGTLNKHEEGWLVRYGDMQFIPLHPHFTEMMDTCFTSKFTQVVDFEIVTEWENGEVGVNGLTYAKLIHHCGDTNKMIDHIGEVNKMVNHIPDVGKMVEEYGATCNQLYKEWLKIGFEAGYNKAKETLYTEEQVQKMIDNALTNYEIGWADRNKQFSLYEHKETITSSDTPVSKSFLNSTSSQTQLFTEKQVRESVKLAQTRKYNSHFYNADEIIESLKQGGEQ